MKYVGRVTILLFSITISTIESFFEVNFRKKAEMSEKRYREIIDFSPEPILIYQNDRIVFMNDKAEDLMGLRSEHIGKSIFEFVLPEFHTLVKDRIQKANAGGKNVERMELKINIEKKGIFDIEVSSIPIIYDNKPSIEVILKDVTEGKRLEEKSRENEELYRFITENSSDVISYITPNGNYDYLSPSCNHVFGYDQNELIGQSIFHFFPSEEIETISQIFKEARSNFDFATLPHRFRKKDGSFIWLETNARTIRNNEKELVGIVAVSRDIDARQKKEKMLLETNEMLVYLSKMDGLTDIPNRRFFEETLKDEWYRTLRHSMPLSALMIDIDYFKKFNDFYGHQAGDTCIMEVANAIKKALKRPGDFVARYGGEELVVLLPETDEKGTFYLSESILEIVRDLKIKTDVSEIADYVTISIGCATVVPTEQKNLKI